MLDQVPYIAIDYLCCCHLDPKCFLLIMDNQISQCSVDPYNPMNSAFSMYSIG